MMRLKYKGQVTFFILLGLLALFFVVFFVFLLQTATEVPVLEENSVSKAVRTSFSSCLEEQLNNAISTVALHGGYFENPSVALEEYLSQNKSLGIPYYFFDAEDVAPSQELVEEQLARALQNYMNACTDFSSYPYNISFNLNSATVTTQLRSTAVEATVIFPLQIHIENQVQTLDTFPVHVESHLLKLYNAARAITDEQAKHPELLCMTCLSQFAADENMYLGMIELHKERGEKENNYSILYILNDRGALSVTRPLLSFYFAHNFLQTSVEQTLSIAFVPKQTASIGYKYQYQIVASGKNEDTVTFSDDSSVFDIDPETGSISFTPTLQDIGSWIVTVIATDKELNKAQISFVFEVVDVVASEIFVDAFPYFVAHAGEEFNYTVSVIANESVYFFDNTDLFDINSTTGVIQFIPTTTQIGSYNFTITAVDVLGNSAEQTGYMVITQ
jgi:uncharacterized protein YpmS